MPTSDSMFSQEISNEGSPPLRISALMSLVLGLLGSASLLAPVMCIPPLLAVVVGVFAIRPTHIPYSGRSIAVTGICLGTFFTTLGYTHHSQYKHGRFEIAGLYAQRWLNCFNYSSPEFAYELTITEDRRRFGKIDLHEFYKHQSVEDGPDSMPYDSQGTFKSFADKEVVSKLAGLSSKTNWIATEFIHVSRLYNTEIFTIRLHDTNDIVHKDISVEMQCIKRDNATHWRVSDFKFI